MAFFPTEDVSINTIIGAGSMIRGKLAIAGFVRVDGDVDGGIETPSRLIIGDGARVRGDIEARSVTVGGVVQGDIIAPDGVTILASGMVLGSVITRRLQVDDQVLLQGRCIAVNDDQRFADALQEYRNRRALDQSAFAQAGRH